MMERSKIVGLACASLLTLTTACGIEGPDDHGEESHGETDNELRVFPSHVYTGADIAGLYSTPVIALGDADDVSWSVTDANIARIEQFGARALVSGLSEGTAQVAIDTHDGSATANVTVYFYGADERAAGEQAFAQFNCAGCHDNGPDITPSGIGKHSDQEILSAVVDGLNPEGGAVEDGEINHVFGVDQASAAYRGIAAYLRSLPPRESEPHEDAHNDHGH